MNKTPSSRRVSPAKDKHAAATKVQGIPRFHHPSTTLKGDYPMNKVQTLYHAEEFIRRNPDFWNDLVQWALNEAAHNRKFSIHYFVQHYRWHYHTDGQGDDFKINDHWIAIWARKLASEHPEVRGYIELRKSMWDDDYPEAFEDAE